MLALGLPPAVLADLLWTPGANLDLRIHHGTMLAAVVIALGALFVELDSRWSAS